MTVLNVDTGLDIYISKFNENFCYLSIKSANRAVSFAYFTCMHMIMNFKTFRLLLGTVQEDFHI